MDGCSRLCYNPGTRAVAPWVPGWRDALVSVPLGQSLMKSATTQVLNAICAGDRSRIADLMDIVYGDLRRLARAYMRKGLPTNSLRPTELVHEAYLKVVDRNSVDWRGRSHFFAVCARAMRQIMVDNARRRGRLKRGGGCRRIALDDALTVSAKNHEDVLAIDEPLTKLATINTRRATIVEMRFFAGMTVAEAAEALDVSKRTVEAHWTLARAWLRRELTDQGGTDGRGA